MFREAISNLYLLAFQAQGDHTIGPYDRRPKMTPFRLLNS